MEDHNRIHFPEAPTRDLTKAIGVIEDMREHTNVVPDVAGPADREHLPAIFGAGGPM